MSGSEGAREQPRSATADEQMRTRDGTPVADDEPGDGV
jgi:hypothetical protein